MPRINNLEARRESAATRKELRETRTNREQIELILARGGKAGCKEIKRLAGGEAVVRPLQTEETDGN